WLPHRHGGDPRALRRAHHHHQAHGFHGRGGAHARPGHPHRQEGAGIGRHRQDGASIAAIDAMKMTAMHDPDLPGLPRLNVGSVIGGRGRNYNLRGAYTVSDFCTAYVNVRFNTSQSGETVLADFRRTLDALKADDPEFQYEIEFPPEPSRG